MKFMESNQIHISQNLHWCACGEGAPTFCQARFASASMAYSWKEGGKENAGRVGRRVQGGWEGGYGGGWEEVRGGWEGECGEGGKESAGRVGRRV